MYVFPISCLHKCEFYCNVFVYSLVPFSFFLSNIASGHRVRKRVRAFDKNTSIRFHFSLFVFFFGFIPFNAINRFEESKLSGKAKKECV